jgi:hypothetical protein
MLLELVKFLLRAGMDGRLVGPGEVGVQSPSNPTKLVAPGMPQAASPDLD